MTKTIKWAEIEAECGDYRTGFIAVFRRYEGQLTDEKDKQGRTVKVTASSFARHVGIAERTFKDWLERQDGGDRRHKIESRERSDLKKVLRSPEQRRKVIAALPADEVEDLIEDAKKVAVERIFAKQAEHQTKPVVRELMDPADPFKPDEFWADNVLIRIHNNARELAGLMKRGGGLILGAMEMERAFEHLTETERMVAEARAAAQEQLRDRAGVA